jgi:hypothetical protein
MVTANLHATTAKICDTEKIALYLRAGLCDPEKPIFSASYEIHRLLSRGPLLKGDAPSPGHSGHSWPQSLAGQGVEE